MAHTFKELSNMTVAQLREIASGIEHEAVKGYTQLNKAHLIKAICDALGIDAFEHHVAKTPEKTKIKARIKELKKERDRAIADHDHAKLKAVRKQIRHMKKKLRKTMV